MAAGFVFHKCKRLQGILEADIKLAKSPQDTPERDVHDERQADCGCRLDHKIHIAKPQRCSHQTFWEIEIKVGRHVVLLCWGWGFLFPHLATPVPDVADATEMV
jgi:hypothetical protein